MSKTDEIRIDSLEVFARHGVFPEENSLGQKFLVNAVLYRDVRNAAARDDIHSSVHYGEVCEFITRYMKENTFKLLETVAYKMSREILLKFPKLKAVDLEVVKPWAPIGLPVDSVSVSVCQSRNICIISIGSNMGDKEKYLNDAVKALMDSPFTEVLKTSSFMKTKPYGNEDQDDFLNGILEISTVLRPHELLDFLHEIENKAGRERKEHWGPRTLDMDIIFFGDEVISDEDFCIPHVDMENRLFVLEPLCEIEPYFRHPVTGLTAKQMKDRLT